jgi:hypothetical protein
MLCMNIKAWNLKYNISVYKVKEVFQEAET